MSNKPLAIFVCILGIIYGAQLAHCQSMVRVNVGGPSFTDNAGNVWSADTGCSSTTTFSRTAAVIGTLNPTLYYTGRQGTTVGCSYTVDTVSFYNVSLSFAATDPAVTRAGQLLMNVFVNGVLLRSNFDPVATCGYLAACNIGLGPVPVLSGPISITVTQVNNYAYLQAIYIQQVGPGGSDIHFTQEGTGAVTLTLQQKLQEYLYPEDFGAIGNGSTDDTAAWQLALNAAASTNKILACGAKTYKLTKQGTVMFAWDSMAHPYALLLSSAVNIIGNCTLTLSMTDAATSNAIIFQNTSHVRVNGLTFVGTGSQSTQILYGGAGIVFDHCNDCYAEQIKSYAMRGNTLAFNSMDTGCSKCFSSATVSGKQGSHWAAYACSGAVFSENTGFGGTTDADMDLFGAQDFPAVGNKMVNNKLYNYAFEDDTKTIAYLIAQGYTVDSSQTGALVSGNYSYGYSIAIDVKTTSTGTIVTGNTVEKCRICIAARLGENPAFTSNTIISNNSIRPMGGNTDPEPGPYGVYIQDGFGTIVTGNIIEASYLFGAGDQTFYPVYATLSSSPNYCSMCTNPTDSNFTEGLDISNNMLIMQQQEGSTYTYSDQTVVTVTGNSTNYWPRVRISNNNIKFRIDAAISYVPVIVSYSRDIDISGNHFGFQAGTTGVYTLSCSHCTSLSVTNNHLDQFGGLLTAANSTQIAVANNVMFNQIRDGASSPIPLIYSDTSTNWSIVGNQRIQSSMDADNGRFFQSSGSGTSNVILAKNIMDQQSFEDQFYSINGTADANTADIDTLDNLRLGPLAGAMRTFIGTTSAIGGSSLMAGQCSGTTLSLLGPKVGMVVDVYPSGSTAPGNEFYYKGYVSSTNIVTVQVCAAVAGTPASTTYSVRVHQ